MAKDNNNNEEQRDEASAAKGEGENDKDKQPVDGQQASQPATKEQDAANEEHDPAQEKDGGQTAGPPSSQQLS